MIVWAGTTVIESVALVMFGTEALAVSVVVPVLTPVALNVIDFNPPGIVTIGGTETMPVGFVARLTVRPDDGAAADRVKVRVWLPLPLMLTFCGLRLSEALVVTAVADKR